MHYWYNFHWLVERAYTADEKESMSDPFEALILDLLEWIGPDSCPYSEVIEAWRTSCPRLPIWEEANYRGFLNHEHRAGVGVFVSVSPVGRAFLIKHRPAPPSS